MTRDNLERRIYQEWTDKTNLSRIDMYDIINKLARLRFYNSDVKPIKLSPLFIEIAMNNCEEVRNLIKSGADVNQVNGEGMTPLSEAVMLNNYAITKILLENGADVIGTKNFIPLIIAAENHNNMIIELLLKFGAKAIILDEYGFNALHHMFPNEGIANLIITSSEYLYFGHNLYREPDNEQTISCINLLVEHGLDINYNAKTSLIYNPSQVIKLNPLSLVLETSSEEVLQRLINLGAEKKVIELNPSNIYQYQASFNFFKDIKSGDLSRWFDAPNEYLRYLDYLRKIKHYNIEVHSIGFDDGYKRPKIIKKCL